MEEEKHLLYPYHTLWYDNHYYRVIETWDPKFLLAEITRPFSFPGFTGIPHINKRVVRVKSYLTLEDCDVDSNKHFNRHVPKD